MPDSVTRLREYLNKNTASPVAEFDRATDKLHPLDFTAANTGLSNELLSDTGRFSDWINSELAINGSRYGIGGYNEHRTIYSRSVLFDTGEEPRRLHLGTDIWGKAGTKVFCPLDGTVHSFKFNDNFGDYGATIILKHDLEGLTLHTLYGHLSLENLTGLSPGKKVVAGQQFARFGIPAENGHWPPHLHFQLMFDMTGYQGDYPGVCAYSERENWLQNSPDPVLILQYTFQHIS